VESDIKTMSKKTYTRVVSSYVPFDVDFDKLYTSIKSYLLSKNYPPEEADRYIKDEFSENTRIHMYRAFDVDGLFGPHNERMLDEVAKDFFRYMEERGRSTASLG